MSQYNPYAAPQAAPPMGPQMGMQGGSGPQPWEIGDVLSHAWEMSKPNWAALVFSYLIAMIASGIPGQIPGILAVSGVVEQNSTPYFALLGVATLIGMVIGAFFQAGYLKIWLATARGVTPQFADLFTGGSAFAGVVIGNLLVGLASAAGTLLFIVPGVILALGLWFTPYFVVDQGMGPIDAMKASFRVTTGHKGKLLLFGFVAALIILGAELACCLPALLAFPVVGVASTTIYLRITGAGGGGFGSPPPGYGSGYGPPAGYGPPPNAGFGPASGAPPAGGFGAPPGGGYGGAPGGGYGGPPRY